ncbi:MAG TPA: GNAT family N-acetyltransferase [Rickettsia endosymbiont of Pyrocoelia pectoralis]|nr:GNAT family N-acetyltransferase [Rickettsia endosymbiont of Pyrocoelia pectoralis]
MSKEFILIRDADSSYIPYMVSLAYEKIQPQDGTEEAQRERFKKLFHQGDNVVVTAELLTEESVEKDDTLLLGFIIGRLAEAPEVYDSKGPTLIIDHLYVKTDNDWDTIGNHLINDIKTRARRKGASQIVIVCGNHDEHKRQLLKNSGLNIVSECYGSAV